MVRVLIHSNYSAVKTGFGKVMRYVLTQLYKDEEIELIEAANGMPFGADLKRPWKAYGTMEMSPSFLSSIEQDEGKKRANHNGASEVCDNQKGLTAVLSGVDVKTRTFTPKGKPEITYEEIAVKLSDDTANYLVSLRFRMDTRSLFNSLLNAKIGEAVTLEIYKSKKGYLSYSLKNAKDERIEWKYDKEQIPERDPVMVRGEVKSYDYTAIDDFFKKALLEAFGEKEGNEEVEVPTGNDKEEGDSIPF